jgi:predicted dinucleotide-binding enzyme
MKIAIIGEGNVGKALALGLKRAGHEIKFGHRDPKEPVREAAEWGDVIILAVPYHASGDAAKEIGPAANEKVLVDVTNALDQNGNLAVGFTTSAAEELQKLLPKSRVVKAFNTVFSQNQSTGRVGEEQLTAFIAGNDKMAKQVVMGLSRDIGFEPVDVGPLKSARYLEPMAIMIIELAYSLKMGTKIGFKLVKA